MYKLIIYNKMDENYYKLLNVNEDASLDEIKKSYKNLAKKYHPDRKSGNEEMFKKINNAYEVLSDSEKRKLYDKYGSVDMYGQFDNSDPFDIFANVFGNMFGNSSSNNNVKRTKDKKIYKGITLENLYSGVNMKFIIERNKICKTCFGSGTKDISFVSKCNTCNGHGVCRVKSFIGLTIMSCEKCFGTGEYIPNDQKCKTCDGDKVVNKKEEITVKIPKGFNENYIVLKGYSDEYINCETGDLVIHFRLKNHDVFSMNGKDLYMVKKISLKDALCGFELDVVHLDKNIYKIKIDEIISPEYKKQIKNLGMYISDNNYGNLYIKFEILFPKSLDNNIKQKLRELF